MKASQERIARKYAKALFELSNGENLEARRDALAQVSSDFETIPLFREALISPVAPLRQRMEALKLYASTLRSGDEVFESFLCTILNAGRLEVLPFMAKAFNEIIAALKKVLTLEISSAFPLSEEEKGRLLDQVRKEIPQNLASLLQSEWREDKSLIGGVVVRSGDRLLDGSIRGALERVTQAAQL